MSLEEKKLDHQISEENMDNSWKDEFIVLVFSLPIIITFIMPIFNDSTLNDAWLNLASAPEWYQTIISILVLVIFGLKGVVYKVAHKLFETPKKCNCKK